MKMLYADRQGNIYDHPELEMLVSRGSEWALPRPNEMIPLPEESELFLLPNRKAVGYNEETGEVEILEEWAVAAFISPGYTLSAHPAYITEEEAPVLPLFAYGAVAMDGDDFYVAAKQVDWDDRQVFVEVSQKKIVKRVREIKEEFKENRLIQHLMDNCVLKYACPAARNLCLGRYEAPIPTSKTCNARCVGCISQQEQGSKICATPQNRMTFTPSVDEIVELMLFHGKKETEQPIFSFGQGCEGEPLTQGKLIEEAVQKFRRLGGKGTVNVNTNASLPEVVETLCEAGISSIRVSLNSTLEENYKKYYRPLYPFAAVEESIAIAKKAGKFVSFNMLYFPSVTDTEEELASLTHWVQKHKVDFIQLRNLNIDPEMYKVSMQCESPSMGLENFINRLKKDAPWLKFGYFNPYIPE